jgi:hypothetical protein
MLSGQENKMLTTEPSSCLTYVVGEDCSQSCVKQKSGLDFFVCDVLFTASLKYLSLAKMVHIFR